jgi:hypothetical protein
MAKLTMDHVITKDQFLDLVDTAGYAIGYWADRAEVHWGNASDPKYTVWEEAGGGRRDITPAMIEQAMVDVYMGNVGISKGIKDSVTSAIMEEEYGDIDGEAADALVQIALFGCIVYG